MGPSHHKHNFVEPNLSMGRSVVCIWPANCSGQTKRQIYSCSEFKLLNSLDWVNFRKKCLHSVPFRRVKNKTKQKQQKKTSTLSVDMVTKSKESLLLLFLVIWTVSYFVTRLASNLPLSWLSLPSPGNTDRHHQSRLTKHLPIYSIFKAFQKKIKLGLLNGSACKSACHQAWQPEIDPQKNRTDFRKCHLVSCGMNVKICTQIHTCTINKENTHARTHTQHAHTHTCTRTCTHTEWVGPW